MVKGGVSRGAERIHPCPEAILSTSKAWKQPIIPGTLRKVECSDTFPSGENACGEFRGKDSPTPKTPPSEQLVTVSGGGGAGYRHL